MNTQNICKLTKNFCCDKGDLLTGRERRLVLVLFCDSLLATDSASACCNESTSGNITAGCCDNVQGLSSAENDMMIQALSD